MDLQETSEWQIRTATRFWPKVDRAGARSGSPRCADRGPCWLWKASHFAISGYACFSVPYGRHAKPSAVGAHRIAWELWYGRAIPAGLVIDHVCGVRGCVNPRHLEAVTATVNVRRTTPYRDFAASHPKQGVCPQGHVLDGYNLRVLPDGSRLCRICANKRYREWKRSRSTFHRDGAHKTHCKYGHPWVPENIVTRKDGKHRLCRLCRLRYPAAEGFGPVPWPVRKDQRQ